MPATARACFGKWGLGEEGSEGVPNRQGFDEFFGYLNQHHAHNYFPAYLYRNGDRVPQPNVVPPVEDPAADRFGGEYGVGYATGKGAYSAEVIHEEALKFLDESAAEPFFLYYATTLPHVNNQAGRRPGGTSEVPGTAYGDDYAPDYGEFADREGWDETTKGHAAMIALLDRQVGEIAAKVDALGLGESTLIVFTSDNGPLLEGGHDASQFTGPGPLNGYKRALTEGGIRVPTIAAGPATSPPARSATTSPTSATFSPPPRTWRASHRRTVWTPISFAPTLLGRDDRQAAHDHLYWEFYEQGSKQAVRRGDWKAVFRPLGSTTPALYDLSTDLGETRDVAAEHPGVVAEMVKIAAAEHVPDPNWTAKGRTRRTPPAPTAGPRRGDRAAVVAGAPPVRRRAFSHSARTRPRPTPQRSNSSASRSSTGRSASGGTSAARRYATLPSEETFSRASAESRRFRCSG